MKMENLIRKLKISSVVTLILGLLSLSWLILDYFLIKDYLNDQRFQLGWEWGIIIVSAVAVLSFHLAAFITIYYSTRLIIKYRSEEKKHKKAISLSEDTTSQ